MTLSQAEAETPRSVLTLSEVVAGARAMLPVAVFVIPFGVAFGVASVEAGLSPSQAILMSGLAFSGAAQFAALDFLGAPLAIGSLTMVLIALNARHVIMGAALAPWMNALPRPRRFLALLFLSDANFAQTQPRLKAGGRDLGRLLGGGLALWAPWVVGTALGALGGAALGDPRLYGADVAMACFFAAVVMSHLRSDLRQIWPISAAAAAAVLTLELLPLGWNVVLGALVGGGVALLQGPAPQPAPAGDASALSQSAPESGPESGPESASRAAPR